MDTTITATELSKSLSDILSRVKYKGERFIIQRNGEPVAVLEPAAPVLGTPLREIVTRLKGLRMPGEGFADDLEAIQAEQQPIGDSPWDK